MNPVLKAYYRSLPPASTINFELQLAQAINGYKTTLQDHHLHVLWDLISRWLHWYLRGNPRIRRGYEIDDIIGDCFLALGNVVIGYNPSKGSYLCYYSRCVHNMLYQRWVSDSKHAVGDVSTNEEIMGEMADSYDYAQLQIIQAEMDREDPVERLLWAYLEIYMHSEGRSSMGKIASLAKMPARDVTRLMPQAIQKMRGYYNM